MTLRPGKIAGPRNVISVRPLARADLELLREPRTTLGAPQRIRESHRQVARLLALGLSYTAIAEATGYSVNRIGQLAAAPAMQELVARLRESADQTTIDVLTDYSSMIAKRRTAAERHLIDYIEELDDQGELLPPKLALALSADAADRSGYGKMSTVLKPDGDFASKLEAAIRRSGKTITVARSDNVIPIEAPSSPLRRRA